MSSDSRGLTRKQFVAASAAGATAAISAGFSRPVEAAKRKAKDKEEKKAGLTRITEFGVDAKRRDEAVEVLQTMCKAVEENEPGVLVYRCHVSQNDSPKAVLYEVFKDNAAMEGHWTTPHMKEMRKSFLSRSIGGGLFKPPTKVVMLDKVAEFER